MKKVIVTIQKQVEVSNEEQKFLETLYTSHAQDTFPPLEKCINHYIDLEILLSESENEYDQLIGFVIPSLMTKGLIIKENIAPSGLSYALSYLGYETLKMLVDITTLKNK